MNQSLYELGEEFADLERILTDAEGDISDESFESLIDEWLSSLGERVEKKVDGYCVFIRELLLTAEARKAEAARLNALAVTDENKAKRLKTRLKLFFEARSIQSLKTPRFNVAIQKNGGKQPLIIDEAAENNPQELPEQFHRVRFEVNREAIYEALQNGEQLDFAFLDERGTHLRIR